MMTKTDSAERFTRHFEFLYGPERANDLVERLISLVGRYGPAIGNHINRHQEWSERDSILITYGDVLRDIDRPAECRLSILEEFLDEYIGDAITSVHLLPFFPSSSDGGFSVIDYKQVREDLGTWSQIDRLSEQYRIMADLVINHTSRYSDWFRNFRNGEEPGKNYFIEVDPDTDVSEVVRPRNSPLLSPVSSNNGSRCVWTTFSEDQVDVDFSNPDVLFEYLDIFLYYLSQGVSVVRLDAIAYLWKKIGTRCIHLPETHEVVRLFRSIVDEFAPHVTLVTETNVPHEENIAYFGDGDEAHMVYQFSLPPLLLHAVLSENAEYLTRWASGLEGDREGCYFLNFTASHDGIGVRPLEGLVPQQEFDRMLDEVHKREGFVSYKKNKDGTESPYELNISYFDALSDPESDSDAMQVRRFLCTQAIMLAFKGIPGIYFHNLTATENNIGEAVATGQKRAINRKQWEYGELVANLEDPAGNARRVMEHYKSMLRIRGEHAGFHPDAPQEVFDAGNDFFVLKRTSLDGSESVLSVSNITGEPREVSCGDLPLPVEHGGFRDILSGKLRCENGRLSLEPFETIWLLI